MHALADVSLPVDEGSMVAVMGLAETGIAGAEDPGGAGRARGRVGATDHGCRTSR
ncbi:MAG TPA: hypothetical protein VN969_28030 [Streptosporangiaceae bacterium]|nr:hypothetical protein [Streptosporangiaceae bacterium]